MPPKHETSCVEPDDDEVARTDRKDCEKSERLWLQSPLQIGSHSARLLGRATPLAATGRPLLVPRHHTIHVTLAPLPHTEQPRRSDSNA